MEQHPQLCYRSMQQGDYGAAYALWQKTPGIGLSKADEEGAVLQYLQQNPQQSFVCFAGDTLAGSILCGNDGRRAYIHHLAVDMAYRRRGIGTRLVQLALEKQQAQGIGKVHLFVLAENTLGQAFWESLQFAQRGDIQIFSKPL